jgi:hypothetical protein
MGSKFVPIENMDPREQDVECFDKELHARLEPQLSGYRRQGSAVDKTLWK